MSFPLSFLPIKVSMQINENIVQGFFLLITIQICNEPIIETLVFIDFR